MTSDRDEALRRADARAREGQFEAAILEYSRLVEAHPADATLLNALGDLFVRAGAPQRALPLYRRVADAHLAEGFYARAAGFYKKLLKFAPDDEDVLLRLADACKHQGLRADARTYLQTVAAARHRRRDRAGLAIVLCSLDDLDPADVTARLAAVRPLVALVPAEGVPRLRLIASDLEARDRRAEALAVWEEVLRADPMDRAARVALASAALAAGRPHQALPLLGPEQADDGEFALRFEVFVQAGELAAARAALLARVAGHPHERAFLVSEARRVFEEPEASRDWVVACARAARSDGDPGGAAAQLAAFARRRPDARDLLATAAAWAAEAGIELPPALDLEDAEVAPADDAVSPHESWDEPAEVSDDVESGPGPDPEPDPILPETLQVIPFDEPLEVEPILDDEVGGLLPGGEPAVQATVPAEWEPGAAAVTGAAPAQAPGIAASRRPSVALVEVEVDLTDRLEAEAGDLPVPGDGAGPVPPAAPAPSAPRDLDATFASLRTGLAEEGTDLLAIGRTYLAAGLHDQAIEAFTTAAHDRAQRSDAAVALAELFEWRRDARAMVDWLERAADAAPTPAKRGAILYRLGLVLEQTGEPARALAVLLELQAMVPGFRDVGARVARLVAGQAGGGSSAP